jgi:hypothetical protein
MEEAMTKKIFLSVSLATMLVFGMLIVGCDNGTIPEATYTVWTDSGTYSEFTSAFQTTLNDGYYIHAEMSNSQFNQISASLTNEYKHVWTESQIYNWFIGRGFGNAEANQEKSWLITINHGFIASRSGSIVYMLIK